MIMCIVPGTCILICCSVPVVISIVLLLACLFFSSVFFFVPISLSLVCFITILASSYLVIKVLSEVMNIC